VVAHATHDARYGGLIKGEATVLPTFPYVLTTVGTATSQGTTETRARLYVRPQDFEASTSDGTAAVRGQVLVVNLALKGKSEGGKIYSVGLDGKETASFSLNVMTGYLSAKAPFAPVTITCFAEFETAILLLNDSGLITGRSRLDASMDILSKQYFGKSVGVATMRGKYTFARDLTASCRDSYTGVGKWFLGGFVRIFHSDFSLTMAPIPDSPEHAGLPGNAERHGANTPGSEGVGFARDATVDSYIDGHIWDGTYDEWVLGQDVRGLELRDYPELWDPATSAPNSPQPYAKYPGPMRRQYQLLQPGKQGTWMVDTRGPGFNDKAMRAGPVGEARFDEPQSTVDMDLDLKSSMRGRIEGRAVVLAVALLLSYRKMLIEGNVTALRMLSTMLTGNLAKSPEALVPMTRDNVELLNPVRQSNAMYV
jgi:hypothetical protein